MITELKVFLAKQPDTLFPSHFPQGQRQLVTVFTASSSRIDMVFFILTLLLLRN